MESLSFGEPEARSRKSSDRDIPPAIHQAAQSGHKQAVDDLLDDTDVDEKDRNGQTPLHYACIYGWNRLVSFLIEKKANVNARDNFGRTPLHEAVRIENSYNALVLRALIDEGKADVNLRDLDGKTALHLAVARPMTILVEILIDARANPSIPDNAGKNVLHQAAFCHHRDAIFYLHEHDRENRFIEMAAASCNDGNTALHISSLNGDTTVLGLLLQTNNDLVAMRNNNKDRPLSLAIKTLHDRSCVMLINAVVRTYASSIDRTRILLDDLMLAAYWGMVDVVMQLIQYLDINSQNEAGETALHCAAKHGRDGTVLKLLDNGACKYRKNNRRQTAQDVAVMTGHHTVVEVLTERSRCECGCAECEDSHVPIQVSNA